MIPWLTIAIALPAIGAVVVWALARAQAPAADTAQRRRSEAATGGGTDTITEVRPAGPAAAGAEPPSTPVQAPPPATGSGPRTRRPWLLGVAAALVITAQILGGSPSWATTMGHRITTPSDVVTAAKDTLAVGKQMASGWTSAERATLPDQAPPEGRGVVGRREGRPVAVSTVEGTTCAVSAVCPHMGGILEWNDAELSWDCPLHASRFAPDGTLLEGPAVQDLWMLLSGERAQRTAQLSGLLDGYEQFRAFDRRELALVEPLRTLRLIHYSAWLARRFEDPIFPINFPWFGSSDYWKGQILVLQDQCERMEEEPLYA